MTVPASTTATASHSWHRALAGAHAQDEHQNIARHRHRHARLFDQQQHEGRQQAVPIEKRGHRQADFSPPIDHARRKSSLRTLAFAGAATWLRGRSSRSISAAPSWPRRGRRRRPRADLRAHRRRPSVFAADELFAALAELGQTRDRAAHADVSRDRRGLRRADAVPGRRGQPAEHPGLARLSAARTAARQPSIDRAWSTTTPRRWRWASAGRAPGAARTTCSAWSSRPGLAAASSSMAGCMHGFAGNAGHVGHIIVWPNGPLCGCGARGCVEGVASGIGPGPPAGCCAGAGAVTSCRQAQRRRDRRGRRAPGDVLAAELFRTAGAGVGRGIASAAALLDLELVVIGGSIALQAWDLLGPPLEPRRRRAPDSISPVRVRIVQRPARRQGWPATAPPLLASSTAVAQTLSRVMLPSHARSVTPRPSAHPTHPNDARSARR